MYDMRPDRVGWTVYDVETGRPAVLDDLVLTELEHATADELTSLLNRNLYGSGRKRLSKWPLLPSDTRRNAPVRRTREGRSDETAILDPSDRPPGCR